MELILNLVWLALATAGIGGWFVYAWLPRTARRSPLPQLAGVAFVLALLFPVISATDDLHALPAYCEVISGVRCIRAGNDQGLIPVWGVSSLPAILTPSSLPVASASRVGKVDPVSVPLTQRPLVRIWNERGPPAIV